MSSQYRNFTCLSEVKTEMSIDILLYLDLEFWARILKTLTLSLQENTKYFTTRSYMTLTIKRMSFVFKEVLIWVKSYFQ